MTYVPTILTDAALKDPAASADADLDALWESENWAYFHTHLSQDPALLQHNTKVACMLAGAGMQLSTTQGARTLIKKALSISQPPAQTRAVIVASSLIQLGKLAFTAEQYEKALLYFQQAWVLGGELTQPMFYRFLCEAAEQKSTEGHYKQAIQIWQDLACIMQEHTPEHVYHRMSYCYAHNTQGFGGTKEQNEVWGDCHKHDVLDYFHRYLTPDLYLEIGVDEGLSLIRAKGPAIAIDARPDLKLKVKLPETTHLFNISSDAFFRLHAAHTFTTPPELAYIDGMHLFEFALRDFMNFERYAPPYALAVIDDIFPCHPLQAERRRQSTSWTGDVWKIVPVLQMYRPDLTLLTLCSHTTGLLLITGLDSANTCLHDNYARILDDYRKNLTVPQPFIDRTGALPSDHPVVSLLLTYLKTAKAEQHSLEQLRSNLKLLAPLTEHAEALNLDRYGPVRLHELQEKQELLAHTQTTAQLFLPQATDPVYSEAHSLKQTITIEGRQEICFEFEQALDAHPLRFDPSTTPGLIELHSVTLRNLETGENLLVLDTCETLNSIQIQGDAFKLRIPDRCIFYAYSTDPILYLPKATTHAARLSLHVLSSFITDPVEQKRLWHTHEQTHTKRH